MHKLRANQVAIDDVDQAEVVLKVCVQAQALPRQAAQTSTTVVSSWRTVVAKPFADHACPATQAWRVCGPIGRLPWTLTMVWAGPNGMAMMGYVYEAPSFAFWG